MPPTNPPQVPPKLPKYFTALAMASFRYFHSSSKGPKIFDDFLVRELMTDQERAQWTPTAAMARKWDPEGAAPYPDDAAVVAWFVNEHTAATLTVSRSRYAEEILDASIREGVKQYVIIGAGFDTYAFRHADLADRLRVFEVDHPETQAEKRKRIDRAGWSIPASLHFVPADFTVDTLASALARSSYDTKAQSLFTILGLAPYLKREEWLGMLRDIAAVAPVGSRVVFDYVDGDAFVPARASKKLKEAMTMLERSGNPMIAGYEPQALAGELAAVGLCLRENLSPAEIDKRFFRELASSYCAYDHTHFVLAEVASRA